MKLDIIWNITSLCMWDCGICCVDATHVSAKNNTITLKSDALTKIEKIAHSFNSESIFDQALASKVAAGLELSLNEKLDVLENLKGFDVKIDFSGGDPLAISDTLIVIKKASELFGRGNITLTATGGGLTRINIEDISSIIGELNFTYDSYTNNTLENRPRGYAYSNLKQARKFAEAGVKTRAETPLTVDNIDNYSLTKIYMDLHDAKIATHLIMRLFPSGRGSFLKDKIPSVEQYKKAIDLLRELENKYRSPKVKLQCALKFLDKNKTYHENPCDLVKESFGLLPNGTLLASPWAINHHGMPISDAFVLGNLSKTKMEDILKTEKIKNFLLKADDNFGHCKMHAFFNGGVNRESLIFTKSDPLYINTENS